MQNKTKKRYSIIVEVMAQNRTEYKVYPIEGICTSEQAMDLAKRRAGASFIKIERVHISTPR